jgi:hypothetical protein
VWLDGLGQLKNYLYSVFYMLFSFVWVSLHCPKGVDKGYIIELNYGGPFLFCDMVYVNLCTLGTQRRTQKLSFCLEFCFAMGYL